MIRSILFCIGIIVIYSCNDNTGADSQVPPKVQMVMRSPDTAAVEQGIDAVPESNGIQVQWHKLYHPALAYYYLYRKADDELYFQRIKVIDPERITQGGDTTYVDNDTTLSIFKWYQYFVTAANKEGDEGLASDTVTYMLVEKAILISPDQVVVSGDYVFRWSFIGTKPQYFILRIEEDFSQKLLFSNIFEINNFISGIDTLNLSETEPKLHFPEGRYRWRIDCIGESAESSGSESEWSRFFIE